MNRASIFRCLLLCVTLPALCTSCTFFRNFGTGAHMDTPREHPHDVNPSRVREMVVEVTTNPDGSVAEVHFQRSSGKDGIDGYVAESIRQSWPRQPSTRSVASLTYSTEQGFSAPKVISSTPL